MSTITRSAIAINPEGEEADALRGWWDATGCTAVLSHAGEGLASALKCAQAPLAIQIQALTPALPSSRTLRRAWRRRSSALELLQAPAPQVVSRVPGTLRAVIAAIA